MIQNLFEDQQSGNGENGRRNQYSLTQRENDLALLAEGKSNRAYRAVPVPEPEDRQGPPGRDLPQAGRHEPHPGRDVMAVQMGAGPMLWVPSTA